MTRTTTLRIIVSVCFIYASIFFVSSAVAVTKNECINGGGSVSEGSGCKFCVGGKFDLTEITTAGKNDFRLPGTVSKGNDKQSSGTAAGTAAGPDRRQSSSP
jgi:hypothetical protein